MAVPPPHFDDDAHETGPETAPGGLLGELERRQDDVLSRLDDLDAKLAQVLEGLEPGGNGKLVDLDLETTTENLPRTSTPKLPSDSELDDRWDDLPDSAEDWA